MGADMQENINYKEIRDSKIKEYGTEYKDWMPLIVKQYNDRTHFLFELLQNAEDEGATDVKLELHKDKLVIEHNGEPFTKKDIVSITKVAKSTKNDISEGKIGKFGIGFKSVYAYTNTPKIYSGTYAFEIRDFIFPWEIDNINLPNDVTRIEIPFDNDDEISAPKAFEAINRALSNKIVDTTLLFLNCIENLEISIEGNPDKISITREDKIRKDGAGNFIDVKLKYARGIKHTESEYIIVTDGGNTAIKLAFKAVEGKIAPITNSNIYTFFPTDKESHQAFYIHGPFETTPARDNIIEDSDFNVELIENICDGLEVAFGWMKDRGYLSLDTLNSVYPIYKYSEDTIFRAIYDRAVAIIAKGAEIIPTNTDGVFKNKEQIYMPENMAIVDCFSDEDIQRLFNNHHIYWIAKEIAKESSKAFRDFLRVNFEFKLYTWKDVINPLDARFLESKSIPWFEKLFENIKRFSAVSIAMGSNDINVRNIPFIRSSESKHICPYDETGRPQVYLNNPETVPIRIHIDFLNSEKIREYLTSVLRISNYDVSSIAVDKVFPKYRTREVKVSFKDNVADLKTVKDAMILNPRLVEDVLELYIITDGENWYKPSELHVPSGFAGGASIPEYALARDLVDIKYISMSYENDPKLDEKFFNSIGCVSSLKKIEVSKSDYIKLAKKYLGQEASNDIANRILAKTYQHGIKWNMSFEGFPEVLNEVDLAKSKRIAAFLNKSSIQFDIYGSLSGANDKNFSGNVDTLSAYSAIGIALAFIPWIYNAAQEKVAPVSIHRREIDPYYEKAAKRLLDMLPFKEEDREIEAILARIEDPEQREAMQKLLTDPQKIEEYTAAIRKQQIKDLKKQSQKNMTPEEILAEQAKKKHVGKVEHGEELDEAESVRNIDRRTKKLEEQFNETMDHKLNVPSTTLRYTYSDQVSEGEKTFLAAQYNGGVCQICGTSIRKFDDKLYFEAINMLKTNKMANEYRGSLDTGWNSLCLCPNCAAKYMYGIKDMSDFHRQIVETDIEEYSREFIEVHISMQGKDETIKYSPKHFLALKTALQVYAKDE